MLDAEYLGQSIADGHLPPLPLCDREQSWNNAAKDGTVWIGLAIVSASLVVSQLNKLAAATLLFAHSGWLTLVCNFIVFSMARLSTRQYRIGTESGA